MAFETKARSHAVSCSKKSKSKQKYKKTVSCTAEGCGLSFVRKKLLLKHFKETHPLWLIASHVQFVEKSLMTAQITRGM